VTEAMRLIATDVDGTLLGPDKRVTRRTRDAFRRAQSLGGIHFALVSSRMPPSLAWIEEVLEVPCWKIAYDGVMVDGPAGDAARFERTGGIAIEDASRLVTGHSMTLTGVFSRDRWFCSVESDWSRREATNTRVSPEIVPDLLAALEQCHDAIHKLMFRDTAGKMAEMRAQVAATHLPSARWFSNSPTILEVVPGGANKATALEFLLSRLDIGSDEVIVFGDGPNDVPLFERFRNSVAVENAIPEVKRNARHSTARGDEDGVAQFLDSLMV
jgi:Cof subfamily protein (haloacid dehalogenase superfamily)